MQAAAVRNKTVASETAQQLEAGFIPPTAGLNLRAVHEHLVGKSALERIYSQNYGVRHRYHSTTDA
jgi:hypothetical protein